MKKTISALLGLAILVAGLPTFTGTAAASGCPHDTPFDHDSAFDTDHVRIAGGMADFGNCGHSSGVPEKAAHVVWPNPRDYSTIAPRVKVEGRVYMDPTWSQGGCARVRIRYYSGNDVRRTTYSSPLCSGALFGRNAWFTDAQWISTLTRVKICTQSARRSTGSWSTTACRTAYRGD